MHHVEECRVAGFLVGREPPGDLARRRASAIKEAEDPPVDVLVALPHPALLRVGHLLRRHFLGQRRQQFSQCLLEGSLPLQPPIQRVENCLHARRSVVKRPCPRLRSFRCLHPQPQRVVHKGPVLAAARVNADGLLANRVPADREPICVEGLCVSALELRHLLVAQLLRLHVVKQLVRGPQLVRQPRPPVVKFSGVTFLRGVLHRLLQLGLVACADRTQQPLCGLRTRRPCRIEMLALSKLCLGIGFVVGHVFAPRRRRGFRQLLISAAACVVHVRLVAQGLSGKRVDLLASRCIGLGTCLEQVALSIEVVGQERVHSLER
mmetsp:Transcript_49356/g.114080  ORF Transcript_49356/g.114080 Transcript_49356/m.114080 type:complete len:321 (-) Transcript_49356:117-1079(-)